MLSALGRTSAFWCAHPATFSLISLLPSFLLEMDLAMWLSSAFAFNYRRSTSSHGPAHSHSSPLYGHTGFQPAAPCCKITSAALNPRIPDWLPWFGLAPAAKAGCGWDPSNRPATATPPSIGVVWPRPLNCPQTVRREGGLSVFSGGYYKQTVDTALIKTKLSGEENRRLERAVPSRWRMSG